MEIRIERIRPNNVCVCAFDSVKRDTIGEIDLILTISPIDFEVTFQVFDMDTSYNFLIGRPWIHAAGAIPSTLYQMVKFEHENQEIVVHREDELLIYKDPSVTCLEDKECSEHIVYQAFEIVVVDQCEEGTPCPQPFLSNIENFFGIDFQAIEADVKWANKHKNDGWVLPQPIPHLARTFVNSRYIEEEEEEEEEEEAFTAEEIEGIYGTMRQMLYEVHMVQLGEGSSTTEVQFMGQNAKLKNWKATLLLVRQESCSNNADLNNMTCLRTSCPDPNTMSHCETMNQEPMFFEHLRKYDLKLNPAKCAFGVPSGKPLGFIVSRRGIELDPTKIKSIRYMPPLRTKKEVMSRLGRFNYIRRFIAQLTSMCEHIFKLLKKDLAIRWTDACHEAFEKIKEYLSNQPVVVPPEPERHLFLYLTV
ncbi:uncharacterized protein [Nicotiana sylvestris]|uniref:uncharacterized protein n=1 Tax=Nicotiana sylvestris TaxID=4096 RepID=UPI00388C56D9